MPGFSAIDADFSTPLDVLGARRAVEIARRARAHQYAETELREAETKLAALEQIWTTERKDQKRYDALAHDVMRLAEHARSSSMERAEVARLENERRAARNTLARAENEAGRAR